MKITDLNNQEIEITDLQLAIMQADDYRHYRHSGTDAEISNRNRQIFWQDIYDKLLKLTETQSDD